MHTKSETHVVVTLSQWLQRLESRVSKSGLSAGWRDAASYVLGGLLFAGTVFVSLKWSFYQAAQEALVSPAMQMDLHDLHLTQRLLAFVAIQALFAVFTWIKGEMRLFKWVSAMAGGTALISGTYVLADVLVRLFA